MPDGDTEDPGQAIKPVRNGVRVLAEVINDDGELALVAKVGAARGWPGSVRSGARHPRTLRVADRLATR